VQPHLANEIYEVARLQRQSVAKREGVCGHSPVIRWLSEERLVGVEFSKWKLTALTLEAESVSKRIAGAPSASAFERQQLPASELQEARRAADNAIV